MNILKTKLDEENYQKLAKLQNAKLNQFITQYLELCNPDRVFVCDDSPKDVAYIREQAVKDGEEKKLATNGHTAHFDGYYDQARDKQNTKFLLPKGVDLGPNINAINKEEGLKEIHILSKDIMQGHQLYICFFCLGPTNSEFSIPCVQLTDSSYVAHSSDLLYRLGYEEFKKSGNSRQFFKFLHSEGELENGVSKNINKRRVYIDIEEGLVYTMNTQYGGNTIGHKKLAMRLAINKASKEHWLTEHMFIMGVKGPQNRITYFTGAFPSMCGKTSTSMVQGESIVGDDIAYLRKKEGKIYAVNVEKGMFGVINGVNSQDDPILWKVLHQPGEIIFSNVLLTENNDVYWTGKDGPTPQKGFNHSGEWFSGKKDKEEMQIPPSHKNARFTLSLKILENTDPRLDKPEGVPIDGIIYGGRDPDTWVPVEESFDWVYGVITKGACLESELTAAALGKEGVRKCNPMANLAFLSISLGQYIKNHLNFGAALKNQPPIFSVNYFLKDEKGNFLNERLDKKVWLKWMELRCHKEVSAIKIPTGFIPKYEDLKVLFKKVLNKEYRQEDYLKQFTLKIPENLSKIERVIKLYKNEVPDTPEILFKVLQEQKEKLQAARAKYGDYVSPEKWKI